MSDTISLGDLKRLRAAMNGDRIAHGPWCGYCGSAFESSNRGIVATHNAADALIEIALAALADRDVKCTCDGVAGCYPYCSTTGIADRLIAALAKVTT